MSQPENHIDPATGDIVVMRGISKAFDDHQVLNGVDIHLKKGESLVVLGKSGSGKSTLIKCLIGLVQPDAGDISVFGENRSAMDEQRFTEVKKKIGYLFQNAALYDSMSVRDNLGFPLRYHRRDLNEADREQLILDTLDQVGLREAVDQMPAELSGGMSKRIGLARTLIMDPEIVLYDEPTTGLDTPTTKEISQLILDLQEKKNTSSIIITHDMICARMTADRMVMLKDGQIVAEGSFEELERSDDPWIKSFFNI